MTTNKDLIEHVNAQLRKEEEYHRETLECLEIKKELRVRQLVQKVIAEQGVTLSAEDFEHLFQECLLWTNAQEAYSSPIIVNEVQL